MNIRKPVDYGTMHQELTAILAKNLLQMDEIYAIGKVISQWPEKGAAVAAAEFLRANFPDRTGFSPRNVRRMRDFYKTYAMFIALLLNFSWFFGIHNTVYSLLTDPIEYGNLSLNAAAFAAGTSLPCVFTVSFWCYFGIIGGLGNCLAVSILCLTSKVKEFRTIGRLGVVPAFFGISEPITFGLPIMLNPLMLIPCSLTSVVNVALAFLAMSSNLVGRTYTMLSYNMPSIFGAFFSTGDFKAVILIVVLLLLDLLIYFPFFKAYEKQFLREEEAAAKA